MKIDSTELFCTIDDFCKGVQEQKHVLKDESKKRRKATRKPRLCESEIMTILLLYHQSSYKNFKHFYCNFVRLFYRKDFPGLVSYNRFVELIERTMVFFILLLKARNLFMKDLVQENVYIIDSTHIPVCKNQRISQHKVFRGLAARGKSSTGWFYGFKLHAIINLSGDIVSCSLSRGNQNDRTPVPLLTKGLTGLLIGDRGYGGKKLFQELYMRGLTLITKGCKNMKARLISFSERMLLKKRQLIETTFDLIKNKLSLVHTRHRSPANAFVHIFSTLASYIFCSKKPYSSPINLIPN